MAEEISEVIKKLLGKKRITVTFSDEEKQLIERLSELGGVGSVKDLSLILDKSPESIIELAQAVVNKGIYIVHDKENKILYLGGSTAELPAEELVIRENVIRVGIIADSLLGSKYESRTALYNAHQLADHLDVNLMIHLGVSAGKPTPAKEEEFHQLTAEQQIEYIINNYPRSTKYKTRFISGYHDMQWRKDRINILAAVCSDPRRGDLVYRGDHQSDFTLRRGVAKDAKKPILRAVYHGGDNSPYSKSYPVQGVEENLVQNIADLFDKDKPDIAVVAGQGVYLNLPGETIECLVSVPALRTVPPSVTRKKNRIVSPTVGFVVLTITFNDDGTFQVKRSCYPLTIVKNDYKVKYSDDKKNFEKLDEEEQKVLKLLEESPKTHGELADAIDKSADTVLSIIDSLIRKGYRLIEPEGTKSIKLDSGVNKKFSVPPINFKEYFFEKVEEGAVSDTHFGSVADLIPILDEAYDIFAKRGIKVVNHVGDVTNGPSKHNEHMKGEVYEDRATKLTDLVALKYPYRTGIVTRMVSGNHDGWFMDSSGTDIIRHVADFRPDIDYLGPCEGMREVGLASVYLKHYDWGTGYARSYKPQAVVETILKEAANDKKKYKGKTVVVLSGGGHVYCSMILKGIVFILMPCLQGRTGFVNRLGKLSDVGFLIYSVTYSKDGTMTEFSVDYFDRIARARALERKRDSVKKARRSILEKKKKTILAAMKKEEKK